MFLLIYQFQRNLKQELKEKEDLQTKKLSKELEEFKCIFLRDMEQERNQFQTYVNELEEKFDIVFPLQNIGYDFSKEKEQWEDKFKEAQHIIDELQSQQNEAESINVNQIQEQYQRNMQEIEESYKKQIKKMQNIITQQNKNHKVKVNQLQTKITKLKQENQHLERNVKKLKIQSKHQIKFYQSNKEMFQKKIVQNKQKLFLYSYLLPRKLFEENQKILQQNQEYQQYIQQLQQSIKKQQNFKESNRICGSQEKSIQQRSLKREELSGVKDYKDQQTPQMQTKRKRQNQSPLQTLADHYQSEMLQSYLTNVKTDNQIFTNENYFTEHESELKTNMDDCFKKEKKLKQKGQFETFNQQSKQFETFEVQLNNNENTAIFKDELKQQQLQTFEYNEEEQEEEQQPTHSQNSQNKLKQNLLKLYGSTFTDSKVKQRISQLNLSNLSIKYEESFKLTGHIKHECLKEYDSLKSSQIIEENCQLKQSIINLVNEKKKIFKKLDETKHQLQKLEKQNQDLEQDQEISEMEMNELSFVLNNQNQEISAKKQNNNVLKREMKFVINELVKAKTQLAQKKKQAIQEGKENKGIPYKKVKVHKKQGHQRAVSQLSKNFRKKRKNRNKSFMLRRKSNRLLQENKNKLNISSQVKNFSSKRKSLKNQSSVNKLRELQNQRYEQNIKKNSKHQKKKKLSVKFQQKENTFRSKSQLNQKQNKKNPYFSSRPLINIQQVKQNFVKKYLKKRRRTISQYQYKTCYDKYNDNQKTKRNQKRSFNQQDFFEDNSGITESIHNLHKSVQHLKNLRV